MDTERLEVGGNQDLAIFQNGEPLVIVQLDQVAAGVAHISVHELSVVDYNGVLRCLAMVADAVRDHARKHEPDTRLATDVEIAESLAENDDIPF